MAINQAIYTSSARGIAKGGGLGIHAYNRSCSDSELREFERGFCQYHFEAGHGGANRLDLPRRMLFKEVGGQRYIQAMVTYLGRDYHKETGRMGNLLSHMYSFEIGDMQVYPMQLYGSPDFRSAMAQEEVDGSREVGYLPEVGQVRPGTGINIERVQDFLGGPGRMEFFCHLLAAVFSRDSIHKVILCDAHENILLWLAALQFALPLQSAVDVSFSSYESDPTMSEFDVRGAVPGLSMGRPEDYGNGGQFYVFDGIGMRYPKFDISADYFQDGISFCMAYAYESMEEFYKFIQKYHYHKADWDICAGFKLFQMVQGGMDVLGEKEFQQAVSFQSKYGGKESYQSVLKEMLGKLEAAPQEDLGLVKNACIWLSGYLGGDLGLEEWRFAAACAVRLEKYGRDAAKVQKERDKAWGRLCQRAEQVEGLEVLAEILRRAGEYRRLGSVSAYCIQKASQRLSAKYIGQVFSHFWLSVPQKEYAWFDAAVKEAAAIFQGWEPEAHYQELLSVFLTLQEMGDGEIAGEGMDSILGMIEEGTDLDSLKPQKQGFRHRKKEEGKGWEQLQAKCAFEAFNYTQKNRRGFPVARIRLLHLGRCILKAYEDGIALDQSKSLRVYSKYPVLVDGLREGEFEGYLKAICKVVFSMENEKEDYVQLLTYWILDEGQKELLIGMLFSNEMDYSQKEGLDRGLKALMDAVKSLKDEEYNEALVRIVQKRTAGKKGKTRNARDFFSFGKR
ncbi:MAG: hypothetical protein HFH38_07125 [Lachnospiraceae bacterium]|jgi:hypothetical protein|nr:hypothetical protein [Lachnospiraceae bacterium]